MPDDYPELATIDRLVHHATILEINVESYRRNGDHRKSCAQTQARSG
jgi:DNA replication protein DnaC